MKIDRGCFMKLLAGSLAAAAMPLKAHSIQLIPGRRRLMVEELSCELFRPHLNTRFRMESDEDGAEWVELTDCLEQSRPGGGLETFSLLFASSSKRVRQQRIYRFGHDVLGTFELFAVPVRGDESGVVYEAVINRIDPSR